MRQAWSAATPLFLTLVLAACQNGALTPNRAGNNSPPGLDTRADAEDGLVVGHRLMEAGQYELALKAYYRAAADHGINADVLSALGSANLKLGRLNQAEDLLRQAIKADQKFPAAWNNLGVVLMETGQISEARRTFETAFALDSGRSAEIRENLRLAIANMENSEYIEPENKNFDLVRRGNGRYLLLHTP